MKKTDTVKQSLRKLVKYFLHLTGFERLSSVLHRRRKESTRKQVVLTVS